MQSKFVHVDHAVVGKVDNHTAMLVIDVFIPTLIADLMVEIGHALMVWASSTRATRCPHYLTATFHVPRANWSMQRLSQDWLGLSLLRQSSAREPVFSVVETLGAL